MNVDLALSKTGQSSQSVDDVFVKLCNIPDTLTHFPKLNPVTELAPNRYQWDLQPIGAAGIEHAVSFATDFTFDQEGKVITFTAVPNVGNAELSGTFSATSVGNGSQFALEVSGTLHDIKVPMLLRGPAKPFIKMQFESLIEKFVERVSEAYS